MGDTRLLLALVAIAQAASIVASPGTGDVSKTSKEELNK